MTAPALPTPVARLVESLATARGVEAVTLGGSHATGTADERSDWDLGVFYRGDVDLSTIASVGEVNPPGSWGRFMNGGAWLRIGDVEVDVILRDLDVVEHWSARARRGDYEVDQLLGYLAGFPSYTLLAEVASSIVIAGSLRLDTEYPDELAEVAAARWRFQRDFSIDYARMHAQRGDSVATVGNLARSAMEEAHHRASERHQWVLNEKRLLASVGLADVAIDTTRGTDLVAAVDAFAAGLSC